MPFSRRVLPIASTHLSALVVFQEISEGCPEKTAIGAAERLIIGADVTAIVTDCISVPFGPEQVISKVYRSFGAIKKLPERSSVSPVLFVQVVAFSADHVIFTGCPGATVSWSAERLIIGASLIIEVVVALLLGARRAMSDMS